MPNELEITQTKLNQELNSSLNNASAIITKDYLSQLEKYEIMPPSQEDTDIDIAECGKFYKLSKLVLNKEENFLDKLTTIVNVASSIDCSVATIIRSDGSKIDYYLGIVSKNVRDQKPNSIKRRLANATAFKGAVMGNLVGSEIEELSKKEVETFKQQVFSTKDNCYSSVSGIVALREKEHKNIAAYVQGIENLVDSLKGQKYTIVMLADPVNMKEIEVRKQGYEMLYTQLSTFEKSCVTINQSDTLAMSKAQTEGITEGISKGIAMTQSKTSSKGNYFGGSVSGGINFIADLNVGINAGINRSNAKTEGTTESRMKQHSTSKSVTDTSSASETSGKSLQLSYENRSVKALLQKIDKHLERLDECESFGAFECAAYVIAESRETALTVASNYNALMRGRTSGIEASHINSWFKPEETKVIEQYMESLVHPRFYQNRQEGIIVTPASVISGDELAIQIGLPKKSVNGITVVETAPFGRNIAETSEETINLGNLYHMGHNESGNGAENQVKIDIQSLSMHTFITGSTGAGKSTTIYSILDKLMQHKIKDSEETIKFMVIEPAKGEYKNRFGNYKDVHVYGTNYKKMPLLRINPFSFPEDIHVLEHIDRLTEIFNVCWPMYAAMPAVLKDAIERAYLVSGWNLDTSECRYETEYGKPMYPSFLDVLNQIHTVMNESAYSSDSKGDYKGALCTRLKSLTNGLYRQIFTSDELSGEELFDSNVIIDLSRTGSSETKSLIMGLLVMKLQEYRMANATRSNASLQHITVLEEAHNILKKTSNDYSVEGANVVGKSVEMLANSIAEMRTYGEGFIIADQSPGLMDMSVIRNTNTKIILRLPDLCDRELVGRAAGLNEDQIMELSRLKNFVAAVYQNNWLEPVLCNIDKRFKEDKAYQYQGRKIQQSGNKNNIIKYLLLSIAQRDKLDHEYVEKLTDEIYKLPVSAEVKVSFIKYTTETVKEELYKLRGKIIYELFNSETAFEMARAKEGDVEEWYKTIEGVLEPDINALSEISRHKVIAILANEKMKLDQNQKNVEFFEQLMKYL